MSVINLPADVTRRDTSRRSPRRAITVVVLLLTVMVVAGILLRPTNTGHQPPVAAPPATATVVRIDGQAVPVREFRLFLGAERAATFAHFQSAFGVADSKHFWTTPVHGTTPEAYLKQVALADATRVVVQQDWARDVGLDVAADYPAFVRAWAAENVRRTRARQAHEVIYGPQRYTEADYFTVTQAELVTDLKQALVTDHAVEGPGGELGQAHVDQWFAKTLTGKIAAAQVRTVPDVLAAIPVG